MYYCVITFGCSLNENDSEKVCGILEQMGYERTEKQEIADINVINTCCVRENAEERLFGKLGELKKIKEKNNCIIAIGGCMMQEPAILTKIKKSYPFVDIIFGTHTLQNLQQDIQKIVEVGISNDLKKNKTLIDVQDIDGEIYEGLPIKRQDDKKALVTIMYGCNNFCSYCIVPYVRGRERSRHPENILNEVKKLVADSYKEIVLLGQNVNSYMGNGHITFAELLTEIDKIEGIEKISFLSPHPKDFGDDLINVIAKSKKISRLIHIPLQSGSTSVLKAMNRKYTKEQYLELIEKIKSKIPDALFSTDIIVGFPGETEDDFEDTLDIVKKVNFEQIFMFIYSKRLGTTAFKMQNQIPEDIKHKRFDRLKQMFDKQVEKNNEKYIGTVQKILVEGYSKNNENLLTGRTNSQKIVVFAGNSNLIGQIINVKITSQHRWYLVGADASVRSIK